MNDNLEAILQKVNSIINIDNEREVFTQSYTQLRNKLFELLKKNPVIKSLFNGLQLGGSYGDNLKVKHPNEFDLVFHLKLPESSRCIVRKDTKLPGNVILDLTEILKTIEKQKQHSETYDVLQKIINDKNELMVEKLQSWLQGCFDKALKEMNYKLSCNGSISTLRYQRCGPAHTVSVAGRYEYSVDFVPGILLSSAQNTSSMDVGDTWEAIPKPEKPQNPKNVSFRASYYAKENTILKDKRNLKNAIRIIKKFRDTHQIMSNMKSYFIKTLFLWKDKEKGSSYWNNSLDTIIRDMFDALENSLASKKLRFFWHPELNMYTQIVEMNLYEMERFVSNKRKYLNGSPERIYTVFLNTEERNQLEKNLNSKKNGSVLNGGTKPKEQSKCSVM